MSTPTDPPSDSVPPVSVPIAKSSAPGHSRPRSRPWWMLPAGVVALIAIAVAIAVIVSRHDGSTAATKALSTNTKASTTGTIGSTAAPPMSAGESTLQSHVPASFASTCTPGETNPSVVGATAHISCTDDHLDLDYYLFPGRTSLDTYWRSARTTKAATAGTCSDDMNTTLENYYQGSTNSHLGGQLLCYHAMQAAHIQWEQPNQLIVATADFSGNNQDMAHGHLVQEWRADDLGPRLDSKKAVVRQPCGTQGCMGMTS